MQKYLLTVITTLFMGAVQAGAQDVPHYVGSESCASCHAAETELWRDSHHGLAWTEPSEETVVADFDGTHFSDDNISVDFSKDAAGYHAAVTESDGSTHSYDLHSVVGIAPLQQYLFETAPGKLQSFDVVWDDEKKEWYHLYPDQSLPPGDGLHWTGPYKNWNGRCAECHATGFDKNYDADTKSYHSTQAEIGVGCEACHGPGSVHLEWADKREPVKVPGLDVYGFTMAGDAGGEAWIQQCAGCHSRREPFGDGNPLPGTPYHDSYRLALLTPGLYFPDGQSLDEVYVYGSFLQSKMYAEGVTCMNCHDPHSGRTVAEGNAVCTQCHSPAGNPEFASLPLKEFDSPEHHFHEPGTPGAECKNCHMVERTYMGIDDRAEHSFRIPRPDLSAQTGAPDACTNCHEDKTPDWAAAMIAEWYPNSDKRGPHFGTTFALAARDPAGALPGLLKIAQDEEAADIVRATALYLMTPAANADTATATAPLLQDDSPLVRSNAIRTQRGAPVQIRIQNLVALLADPIRLVRISAVPEFLGAPIAHMPKAISDNLQAAMLEWQASLGNRLDFPETHLVLGGMALTQRDIDSASAAFREAVTLDPQLVNAWSMLARIEAASERPDAARQTLDEGLRANPGDPLLEDLRRQLQ